MIAKPPRRTLLWGLGAVAVLAVAVVAAPGVSSLLLASFIVAYVTAPVVDVLARIMPRSVASVVVLLIMGVVLFGLVLLLVPVLAVQWKRLAERLPQGVAYVQGTIVPWVQATFGVEIPQTGSDLAQKLRDHLATIGTRVAAPLGQMVAKTFGGVIGIAGAIANVILIPVLAFYLMRDYHAIWPRLQAIVPQRVLPRMQVLLAEIDASLGGFVRGQLIVVLILGSLIATGLSILGIEGGIVIGFLSGLLNMVPYVGTALGVTLSLLMAALEFSGWAPVLGVIVVFVVANTLEGLVITPRIVGDKTGLSPIVVMVAILAGGEMFGFVGLLLAVPAAAVLKVLLRAALDAYLDSAAPAGTAPVPAAAIAAPTAAAALPPLSSDSPPPRDPAAERDGRDGSPSGS